MPRTEHFSPLKQLCKTSIKGCTCYKIKKEVVSVGIKYVLTASSGKCHDPGSVQAQMISVLIRIYERKRVISLTA